MLNHSLLLVQSVVGQLHRQLNKSVWMELLLFDGGFTKCCESIAHNLEVLYLENRERTNG